MIQHSIHVTFAPPTVAFVNPIPPYGSKSMAIKVAVCRAFDVAMHEMLGQSKAQRIARARFAAYLLMKQRTDLSLRQIAQSLGRSDHSTVKGGIERAKALIDYDPKFAATFARAAG